jgi:REP element-mobilizing transposase RayT
MNFTDKIRKFRPEGWHSRGYIPHYDAGQTPQFLTFRLADSVPALVIDRWRAELEQENDERRDRLLRRRIENYLDQGYGACYLRVPSVARMVQNSLLHFDDERYRLSAWVVMPNHVHVLLTPFEGFELSEIVHSIKSYTAHEANKILRRTGEFWQEECFDRLIRNGEHFRSVMSYIEKNPVKARLCREASDWPFSSAWFRKREDVS